MFSVSNKYYQQQFHIILKKIEHSEVFFKKKVFALHAKEKSTPLWKIMAHVH